MAGISDVPDVNSVPSAAYVGGIAGIAGVPSAIMLGCYVIEFFVLSAQSAWIFFYQLIGVCWD